MLNGVNHANAQNENVFNCWQVEGSKAGEATHSEFHLIFFPFRPFLAMRMVVSMIIVHDMMSCVMRHPILVLFAHNSDSLLTAFA